MEFRVPSSKRSPERPTVILDQHGDFTSFYEIFIEGCYDFLLERLHPRDMVIDAGANIGLFTLLASQRVGPKGSVVAIEPNPANYARLLNHIERNRLGNVHPFNNAVGNLPGQVVTMTGEGVRARIVDWKGTPAGEGYQVSTTTLDEAQRLSGSRACMLKMDIEGAERFAFDGIERTMADITSVGIEVHDPEALVKVREALRSFRTCDQPRVGMGTYLSFGLRHPLLLAKLERQNRYRSVRRMVRDRGRVDVSSGGFPVNLFAVRR